MRKIFISFLPILCFVAVYVGSGIYFSINDVPNAFYKVSPAVAIIPALILGWLLHSGSTKEKMHDFLDGVRHRDIITMCIIFVLAGAFGSVTKGIGSVDATVNLALSLVSAKYLLVGVFVTGAFISTAIGTSMGTIATLAPIAAALAAQGAFPCEIGMATVISGAMFGDNLSMISDTTIAAVLSQEADLRKKLYLNLRIAIPASIITICLLLLLHSSAAVVQAKTYALVLVAPYLFLIALAVYGVNVFSVLILAIIFAFIVGMFNSGYSLLNLSEDLERGFASMYDIMFLSMLVGGLSGLSGKESANLAHKLSAAVSKRCGRKMAQLLIGKIVSIFDILLANNTVAIIFSGEMARNIAKKFHIPAHYSAVWLDSFSCVFQGIIPYGAQILLASSVAGISPLSLVLNVYYCYALFVVCIVYILLDNKLDI